MKRPQGKPGLGRLLSFQRHRAWARLIEKDEEGCLFCVTDERRRDSVIVRVCVHADATRVLDRCVCVFAGAEEPGRGVRFYFARQAGPRGGGRGGGGRGWVGWGCADVSIVRTQLKLRGRAFGVFIFSALPRWRWRGAARRRAWRRAARPHVGMRWRLPPLEGSTVPLYPNPAVHHC